MPRGVHRIRRSHLINSLSTQFINSNNTLIILTINTLYFHNFIILHKYYKQCVYHSDYKNSEFPWIRHLAWIHHTRHISYTFYISFHSKAIMLLDCSTHLTVLSFNSYTGSWVSSGTRSKSECQIQSAKFGFTAAQIYHWVESRGQNFTVVYDTLSWAESSLK